MVWNWKLIGLLCIVLTCTENQISLQTTIYIFVRLEGCVQSGSCHANEEMSSTPSSNDHFAVVGHWLRTRRRTRRCCPRRSTGSTQHGVGPHRQDCPGHLACECTKWFVSFNHVQSLSSEDVANSHMVLKRLLCFSLLPRMSCMAQTQDRQKILAAMLAMSGAGMTRRARNTTRITRLTKKSGRKATGVFTVCIQSLATDTALNNGDRKTLHDKMRRSWVTIVCLRKFQTVQHWNIVFKLHRRQF
jgi:hypothetical protein